MRRALAISATLVLALSLSACGGDDPAVTEAPEIPGTNVGAVDAVRCAEVSAALASASAGATQALTGSVGADFAQQTETLEQFASEAPDEIAADLQVIADGYAAVAQALEGSVFDPASGQVPPPEVLAELEAASQALSTPEFQAALQKVSTWFATECGVPAP